MLSEKDISLLDDYLGGKLQGADLSNFELRLQSEPALQAELEFMQAIEIGAERLDLKADLQSFESELGDIDGGGNSDTGTSGSGGNSGLFSGNKLWFWIGGAGVITAFTLVVINNNGDESNHYNQQNDKAIVITDSTADIVDSTIVEEEPVKKLKDDMYDKHFSKIIQSENDLTLIDLRSEKVSKVNFIFDVSAGLKDGFETAYDTYIKPVTSHFSVNADYYECGKTEEISVFKGDVSEMYYHFKDPASYGGKVSLIEAGLKKAVSDPNMVSVFYTDFLFDDGSRNYSEKDKNGNEKKISNKLTEPWGASLFQEWFAKGNRVHVHAVRYGGEKNYYAIYFVPQNSSFEMDAEMTKLFGKNPPVSFDPLNLKVESDGLVENLTSTYPKTTKDQKNASFDENGYAVVSVAYETAIEENLSSPGKYNLVNNSPWEVDFEVGDANITSTLRAKIASCALALKSGSLTKKKQTVEFFDLDTKSNTFSFSPMDKSVVGSFNAKGYPEPDVFAVRYDLNISKLTLNESIGFDKLSCYVKPDGQSTDFLNESLSVSIKEGLLQSKDSVKTILTSRPLFKFYTFTSIHGNN